MALVNCSTCGKQISDQATACPGCGAPVRVATSTIPNIYSNKCVGNAIMLFGIAMFTVFLLCVWYVYGHRGEEYNLHALFDRRALGGWPTRVVSYRTLLSL